MVQTYCPFCGHESDGYPTPPCHKFRGTEEQWRELQALIFDFAAIEISDKDLVALRAKEQEFF